jgi:hypothetical protein
MSSFRGIALALLVLAVPAFAQNADRDLLQKEFSADIMMSGKDKKQQTQRVYVSKGRVRLEDHSDGQQKVFIHDLKNNKSYLLVPEQKMAMEMASIMSGVGRMYLGFLPTGSAIPCNNALLKDLCEKLGTEKVNGRSVEKWRFSNSKDGGRASTLWIDNDLKMLVRMEGPTDTLDMKNFQEGKQDDSLFEVPKDYQLMAMPGAGPGAPMPQGSQPPPRAR